MGLVNYLVLLVMVLLSVAFVALMEQKVLSGVQIRIGPNYSGYWGVLQSFADGLKLLSKEVSAGKMMVSSVYLMSPIISLVLSMLLWLMFPYKEGGLEFVFGIMLFVCLSGLMCYPLLMMSWSSNCKYSIMGGLRAVAQMVSYEVSLIMVLLCIIWLSLSLNFKYLQGWQEFMWNICLYLPLSMVWFVTMLAETNRTPYDFSEGESELVSGFNTEFGGGGFTLIFVAEYSSILFMSFLFCILFVSSSLDLFCILKSILVSFFFIWVRGTLPRYRYDKLMDLAWKVFLPVSLVLFLYYLFIGYLVGMMY